MMKRLALILILIIAALVSLQCAAANPLKKAKKGAKEVSFVTLKNYYVRNEIPCSRPLQLILDREEDFQKVFGPAAIMGGAPTDIDWKRQFVVAVLLPETNKPTMVTPMKVKQSPGNVIFYYQVNTGSKTKHKLVPFAAVALERSTDAQQMQVFFIED